jgi:hypothetical protein
MPAADRARDPSGGTAMSDKPDQMIDQRLKRLDRIERRLNIVPA